MSYGSRFFRRNSDYRPLRRSLEDKIGKAEATRIFEQAGEELDRIMAQFPDIPKGERSHTDQYIFPRAALYRVLRSAFGEEAAMEMIDRTVNEQGEKMGAMLRKFTSLPLMERVFLKIFARMAKNMFGEKNGFAQRSYPTAKGTVRFDILDCTYYRYCQKCGCPELIHTFCNTDAYCFGNLSKIRFEREQTLEYGEKCDFTMTIISD